MNLAALLGLALVVFASSNIDDIFLVVGFLADPHFRLRNVAIGQYLGIGILVIVSVAASLVSLVFAPEYVGLLGLLPMLIGTIKLFTLLRARGNEDAQHHEARGGSIGQIASVATVTMANGGDNIGIYAPLFATQSAPATAVAVVVFMILTALWIGIAHRLVSHRTLVAPIRRYGHIAVLFVLIGLGIYILRDAGSLQLLQSIFAQKS
jgi:cadmium resistance protein CadD (predicted permease)